MTETRFDDRAKISGARVTADGYLVARVKAARTGIQEYLGDEVGRPGVGVVRVFRPEDEVMSESSMGTFKGKPITLGHPKERVTADNHKELARGHISRVARDGEAVALDVAITDAETVKAIEAGTRELSAGYVANLDWTAGKTADGQAYDAVQRNIFVDHVAIVPQGRAGSEFRIGDGAEAWGASPIYRAEKEKPMADALKTVVVDGLSVETTDQGVAAINKLTDKIVALGAEVDTLKASIADGVKDGETKDAKIAALETKVEDAKLTDAQINQLVKDRAATLKAGERAGLKVADMDDMSEGEIKKKVVGKALKEKADKMDDAQIAVAFDVLSATGAAKAQDKSPLADGLNQQDTSEAFGDAAFKRAGVKMKKED